ncbi:winged helix-turn-helix domain-containing protein [Dyella sp. 20L07]|uniref:transcriptional regulator n=1 Tax=Dyella sp. 20L07 TaxID=3384240 RepID=UPI003D2A34E2
MAQFQADTGWIYHCDDIVVEPRAHRLERAGAPLPVEPKAYAVLVVLLQQAGEVVSKDELLDAAWGHRHVTPGVLTHAISQLRRSLGDCASSPRYIGTVHCLGYRFIGEVKRVAAPAIPLVEPDNDADVGALEPISAGTRPAGQSTPPLRWLAAAITVAVIVAMLAAASLWHPTGDRLPSRYLASRSTLVLTPGIHNQGSYPRRWPHNRRIAMDYGESLQLRAAGDLFPRSNQAPPARA